MMSDENKQQHPPEAAAVEAGTAPPPAGEAEAEPLGWLPPSDEHRWGEPIPRERQVELDGYLQ